MRVAVMGEAMPCDNQVRLAVVLCDPARALLGEEVTDRRDSRFNRQLADVLRGVDSENSSHVGLEVLQKEAGVASYFDHERVVTEIVLRDQIVLQIVVVLRQRLGLRSY